MQHYEIRELRRPRCDDFDRARHAARSMLGQPLPAPAPRSILEVMSDTKVDLARTAFESSFAGDPGALARRLAHDAQWLGYPPSSPGGERRDEIVMTRATRRQRGLARHGRDAILATLAKRQRQGIVTEVVDVLDGPGDEVLLRWFGDRMQRFRVAGAVASIVVTVRAGEIVRMGDYMGYDRLLAVAG